MPLDYTPELSKAKRELFRYMKEHNLSFEKDYRNDPIHGRKISLLLLKLNKERDKILEDYPMHDQDNNRKFLKLKTRRSIMAKVKKTKVSKAKEADELVEKKPSKKVKETKEKEVKKEGKKKGKVATKYNYPLVDGREMTASEKKKYRMEQRKLANGEKPAAPKEKKEKKAKDSTSKEKKVKVSVNKSGKKSKKAKKEED